MNKLQKILLGVTGTGIALASPVIPTQLEWVDSYCAEDESTLVETCYHRFKLPNGEIRETHIPKNEYLDLSKKGSGKVQGKKYESILGVSIAEASITKHTATINEQNADRSTVTFSHDSGIGTDRGLFVTIGSNDSSGYTVSSASYNGTSLTEEVEIKNTSSGDVVGTAYYLPSEPTSGSNNLTVNWTGNTADTSVVAWALEGVDQTTQVDVSGTAQGNGSPSQAVTIVTDGAFMMDGMASEQSFARLSCDYTEINLMDGGSDYVGNCERSGVSTGSQTLSWTDTDNDEDWAQAVIVARPSAGAPPAVGAVQSEFNWD